MKSVLVIDTPKDCLACPCVKLFADAEYCSVNMKPLGVHIPKWCPLRPLPEKKETRNAMQYRGLAEEYRKEGWNECLEEIVGDTEMTVVRCKDCKYNVANMEKDPLDMNDYTDIVCSYFMTDGMEADDFCSKGELYESNSSD